MHLGVHSFALRLEIAMIKLKLIEADVGNALGFVGVRVPVHVFVDHIVRYVSTGRAKVASRPQMASPYLFLISGYSSCILREERPLAFLT